MCKDVKKVFVVIVDKLLLGNKKIIGKEVKELDIDNVKVVFVVIGGEIDVEEIEEILLYKDVLVIVF